MRRKIKDRSRQTMEPFGSRFLLACLDLLNILTAPACKARWVSLED